jgi:hypothetical protein
MITRRQYIQGEAAHREYYGQFVCDGIKKMVLGQFSLNELRQSPDLRQPLERWDRVISPVPFWLDTKFKACGDYPTAAGLVCIAKEAARQILEQQ